MNEHETVAITHVPFDGGYIDATQNMQGIWAGIKRMCEDIGVDAEGQRKKLKTASWATTEIMSAVAEDGKIRQVDMLRADCIPMWLAGINPAKVAPEVRPRLEAYQAKAKDVLAAYFMPRAAHEAGVDVEAIGNALVETGRKLREHEEHLASLRAKQADDHTAFALLVGEVRNLKERFKDVDERHPNGLFGEEALELHRMISTIAALRLRVGEDDSHFITAWTRVDVWIRRQTGFVGGSGGRWCHATIPVGRAAKSIAQIETSRLESKIEAKELKDRRTSRANQLDLGFDGSKRNKRIRRIK